MIIKTKLLAWLLILQGVCPLFGMLTDVDLAIFKQERVEYTRTIDFSHIPAHYKIRNDTLEDTPEQDELNARYSQLVLHGYHAPVYLQHVNQVVNYRVFAGRDFEPGEMIAEYAGKIIKYSHLLDGKGRDYAWNYVDDRFAIDGYQSGNYTRFVNHSYRPNLRWEFVWANNCWHLIYIVDKPIKKDEQLFISYGWKYWVARGIDPDELNSAQ